MTGLETGVGGRESGVGHLANAAIRIGLGIETRRPTPDPRLP